MGRWRKCNPLPRLTGKPSSGAGTFNTSWTYNSADLPLTITYPDGEIVTNTYNAQMLLDTVSGTSTYVSSTTYDSANRMDLRAFGNGTQADYTYYPWNAEGGRLQTLKSGKTANPTSLQNLTYTYDNVGNITQIVNSKASETNNYGYDALNRLTSWSLGGTNETYTYDPATGNLDVKAGVNLNYNDLAHVHAVTHIGSTQKYWYDANGNQTKRIVSGQTFNLTYDAENRLVSVSGATTASFVYDGDGKQVKATVGGTTTYYVGSLYELTGSTITKYYFAGAQRVAMRTGSTLTYLLGDHLGSTALSVNTNGALVAELRYKPWGETRYTSGTMATDYQFTSQRNEASLGLYFYNARWYDSAIGRFTSADSIVPGGVQGYDRYAYANNDPILYTDPTGHKTCESQDNDCSGWENVPSTPALARQIVRRFGVRLSGNWDDRHILAVAFAVVDVGTKFASERESGESASQAFKTVFGSINMTWGGEGATGDCSSTTSGGCTSNPHQINFWSMSGENDNPISIFRMVKNVVHELFHAYDHSLHDGPRKDPRITPLLNERDLMLRPNPLCDRCYDWQQHPPAMDALGLTPGETFADMGIAWTYDAWNTNPENALHVDAAQSWMNEWLP